MKKRVISMMLAAAMLLSLASTLTISIRAATKTHYCFEGSALCDELPSAYRAMQVESPEEFFVTWINLYRSYEPESESFDYDAEKFRERIENSLSTTLANNLDSDALDAAAFISCLSFGSMADYGFQEYDIYDALFLSMLLKTAESDEIGDGIKDFCDNLMDCLDTVVFLGEYTGTFKEFIKSGGYSIATICDLLRGGSIDGKYLCCETADSFIVIRNNTHFANLLRNVDDVFGISANNGDFKISGLTVLLTLIQIVLETINEVTELFVAIYNCILVYRNVGPTYAEVLKMIAENTDNITIEAVAIKYHLLINSETWISCVGAACVELVLGGIETLAGIGEIIIKTLAGVAFPAYGISLILLSAIDVAFATNARIESSYALLCLRDMDAAMLETLTQLDASFKEAFDAKDDDAAAVYARQYVTASIMCLRMLHKEYEYCEDFFTAVYDTGLLSKHFTNTAEFEGWKAHISFMQAALQAINTCIFEEGSAVRERYHNHVSIINQGMTVTYDLNGGTGSFLPQHKEYNKELVIHTDTPTKEGYTFDGWWPAIDGFGIKAVDFWYYKNENAISPEINPCYFADEIVLTAQWTVQADIITYNANKGTGAPASHENTGNTVLSTQMPTRYGYNFLGWDENPNAKAPTYPRGQQNVITKEGSVTLYAIWDPVTFNVIFDANGGVFDDAGTTRISKPKQYSQAFALDVSKPYGKEGHVFSGRWALTTDGSGETYAHGAKNVYDIGDSTINDKVLYAVWKENTVTESVTPGDMNGDSAVNNLDLLALQKHLEGISGYVAEGALDVDGSGSVDENDFSRLYQYLTGWDVDIYPETADPIRLMADIPPLNITQPRDNEWILYSDPPRLEWEAVAGAAGYRVSIRNIETDELLTELKWTTQPYMSLNNRLDVAASQYRIWVGAMPSKAASSDEALAASTIVIYTQPEAPKIEEETWEAVTHDSITLSMNITRNNGNAITDSGFYIVKNGLPTSEWVQYSFKNHGSYSATAGGYKEMTITGLSPATSYNCYAYAVNGVGETITDRFKVTTANYDCPHTSGVYINEYPEAVSYVNTGNDAQHQEIWYFDEYCNYCKEVVNEAARTEIYYSNHTLVANVCTLCKYAVACAHPSVTKQYYTTTYQIINETEHVRNAFYEPVCNACGEITDPRTLFDAVEEPHVFQNDICTGCGYELAVELSVHATVNQTEAKPGDTISVTAKGAGGAGAYQYAFVLLKNGELIDRASYSGMSYWSHTVTEYGSYQFKVYCMDGENTVVTADSAVITALSETEMSLYGSQASVAAGETVQVSFELVNNIGWKSLKFDLVYDASYLTLQSLNHDGGNLSQNDVLCSPRYDSPFTVNCFATESSSAVCDTNGRYITATFRVAANAPEGYYPIGLDYDKREIFDAAGEPLDLVTSNAYIIVESKEPAGDSGSDAPSGGSQDIMGGYVIQLRDTTDTWATISAMNKTDESIAVTVMVAVYDYGGCMVSCQVEKQYWNAGSSMETAVSFPADQAAATIKVFLLERDTLVPIRSVWKQHL